MSNIQPEQQLELNPELPCETARKWGIWLLVMIIFILILMCVVNISTDYTCEFDTDRINGLEWHVN